MKIAIDLNDVLRAYTTQFGRYYQKAKDHLINLDGVELTSHDLSQVFRFKSDDEYQRFLYEDYVYEIFGAAPPTSMSLSDRMNDWLADIRDEVEGDEPFEFIIVSPMEYGMSIQSTHFFLAKMKCRFRETYFPIDSSTIWDKCDVLITANPLLLNNKPEGKISIKIEMPYNINIESDYTYDSMMEFMSNKNNLLKLNK